MILKSNTFQLSSLTMKEENNDFNRENDDDLFLNGFNIQSSAFFNNHHLSSKSDDFEKFKKDYDINFDFFKINSQSNLKESKADKLQNNLNKSFDFKINKKNLIVKEEKNEMNDPSSYLKMNNKANSAKMPQTKSNYILKSELNMMNNDKDFKVNNNFKNNNLLFNYYSDKNNFTLRNRNVDNQREKYILDIVDDEDDGSLILDNNNNEDYENFNYENNNYMSIQNNNNFNEDKEEKEFFSHKEKSNAFTLNYLNKNFNLTNKNLNQNINLNNRNNNNLGNNNQLFQNENVILNIKENFSINNNLNKSPINNNYDNNTNILNNKINIINNNNNIMNNKIEDEKINLEIISHAPSFIRDQTGCRLIQKKIDENSKISDGIFESLYYELMTISTDLFGNYVVQKLLDNINIEKLEKFINLISIKFNYIATSTYGTRVIQKLLEILSKENMNTKEDKSKCDNLFNILNKLIISNIVSLSSDSNSSHIIIKYVNVIKHPKNVEMFESVYNNFIPLCKDKHGCCVIQKCIEAGIKEQKEILFNLSNQYCRQLISDQFGNYVIQYVVGLNNNIINKNIVNVIMEDLIHLCKEKYASNVIEKFIFIKSSESKEVIQSIINHENNLHQLIINQYGNYIVQRILSIVTPDVRMNLLRFIVSWYEEIKNLSFGNRLITKLNERYPEFTSMINNIYGQNYSPNHNNNGDKFKNNNNIGNVNIIQMNNYLISNNNNNNYIGNNNNCQTQFFNNNNLIRYNYGLNNIGNYGENNSPLNFNQFQQMQYQMMMMNYMNNVNNHFYSNKN